MSIFDSQSMGTRLRASAVVIACALTSIAVAAPYKPAIPDEVLLKVDPAQSQARANLQHFDGSDAKSAIEVATKFVALGRAQHDERYFGYASATLQSWKDETAAPGEILLLKADVAQYQHRFDDAAKVLDGLIARAPNRADARLMRAQIRLTQGQPQLARPDCQRLFALRETFSGAVCLAQASSMSGQLAASYRLVSDLIERSSVGLKNEQTTAQLSWASGVAAEMAERLGDQGAAETHLRYALQLTPVDFTSRLQLCDLLISLHRATEALHLIEEFTPSDPILLRRALAAKQIGDREQEQKALAEWRAAVERSSQLGVTLHLRELARGQLELLDAPARALESARTNWRIQRESVDALLLAQAARASRNAGALQELDNWRLNLHFEDARLDPR